MTVFSKFTGCTEPRSDLYNFFDKMFAIIKCRKTKMSNFSRNSASFFFAECYKPWEEFDNEIIQSGDYYRNLKN